MRLLDPGDCSHPPGRQHDNGIQYGLNNEPLLRLHTCLDCGTTLAEKIEGEPGTRRRGTG